MPVYEFSCKKCGTKFSELFYTSNVTITEVECPNCKAHEAQRQLSVFASETKGGSSSFEGGGCGPGCGCHHN